MTLSERIARQKVTEDAAGDIPTPRPYGPRFRLMLDGAPSSAYGPDRTRGEIVAAASVARRAMADAAASGDVVAYAMAAIDRDAITESPFVRMALTGRLPGKVVQ